MKKMKKNILLIVTLFCCSFTLILNVSAKNKNSKVDESLFLKNV